MDLQRIIQTTKIDTSFTKQKTLNSSLQLANTRTISERYSIGGKPDERSDTIATAPNAELGIVSFHAANANAHHAAKAKRNGMNVAQKKHHNQIINRGPQAVDDSRNSDQFYTSTE